MIHELKYMYTKWRWKLDKYYWILEKCFAHLYLLSPTRFNVTVTRNLESALISMKLKFLIRKNVSYASCATSIVANNSHSLYRIKNNTVRTDRVFIIRNNYPLLSTRADNFIFSRTRPRDHSTVSFSFFMYPRSFTTSLFGQVSDMEKAGPRYQEEGTPGRLSRATAAAAGSKLPASGPHYITLLLC